MRIFRILYLALPLLSITLNCNSQDWNAIFMLETDAEYYIMDGDYNKAAETYLKALKKFPESANLKFKAGYCYLKTDDQKKEALYYLEEASQNISDRYNEKSLKEQNAPPEVLYSLGIAYMIDMNFDKAAAAFTEYKKYVKSKDVEIMQLVEQHLKSCSSAKDFVNNPIGLNFKNLGDIINNDDSNFNPVVSGDGKTLAYTTRTSTGNKIFVSKFENGAWTKPIDITRNLGSKFLKTSCLAYEGQELYLIEEDEKNSEIVVSFLQKNKWSKPVKAAKPINSKNNENHVCVSHDGNTVYFSSDRKGGLGGFDIYKTSIVGDKWSEPVNLGPNVNTPLDDDSPFLTPDEKYLFFSSEGHNSIGGYDIFYINLDGNPIVTNVGYPLNTPDDNIFYQPTGLNSGYYSFYSKDGKGGLDINSVEIIPYVDLKINITLAENAPTDKDYTYILTNQATNKVVENKNSKGTSQFTQRVMPGKYSVAISGEAFQMAENIVEIPDNPSKNEYSASVVLNGVVREKPVEIAAIPETKPEEISKPVEPKKEEIAPIVEKTETKKEEVKVETPKKEEIKKREVKKPKVDKPKPKPVPTPPVKPAVAVDFKKTAVASTAVPTSYSVQLLAVKQPVDINFIDKLDSVSITISPDGYYRYSVGNTGTVQESEEILTKLKAKGISHAYVRINREHPGYTIQIIALAQPKKLNQFSSINDLMVYKGSDGLYRYCVGKYASPEDAQEDLSRLATLGYGNAFVRTLGK
ncbi:MAG: SPOR domain-containing protein [Bacteroidales bacterium]